MHGMMMDRPLKIIDILKSACKEDVEKSIKLAFFTRDPRKNGKGYRKIGRSIKEEEQKEGMGKKEEEIYLGKM